MPKEETQFTKTRQPKNPGRKPSHLKKYLKENNIGTADVRKILGGILTECKTIEDVRRLLKDPKTPPIVLFPISALLKDMISGKLDAYSFLMRYGYGEPKQEVESVNANIDVSRMDPGERKKLKIDLIRKLVLENKDIVKEMIQNDQNNTD